MNLLRRPTDPALERDRNKKRRPTLPFEGTPGKVQDKFPAYDDFGWDKIEKFLKQKWPAWKDFKPTRMGTYWQFEIPEKLSEGDVKALRQLRDAPNRKRRPSVSEESSE